MLHSKLNRNPQQLVSLYFHLKNETTSDDLGNLKKARNGLIRIRKMACLTSFSMIGQILL
jgi:hypothetical protein